MSDGRETILVLGVPPDRLRAKLEQHAAEAKVVVADRSDDIEAAAQGIDVILAWTASRDMLRRALVAAPGLDWVHIMSAGFNHLVSTELAETTATVTNGRGAFSSSLAEWVIGAVLFFAKDFRRLIRQQAAGRWLPFTVSAVSGATIGIVGYGDIGRKVGVQASALGMRVLGLAKSGPGAGRSEDDPAEEVFAPEGLIHMIEQSDYVVVTAPLTPDTRGMIGEAEIAAMKREAVLINVGRGPVVEEGPLHQALSEGRIKGAALDVFHREPLPEDDPLYSLENILLSPHCADQTPLWLDDGMELFLANLRRYRAGEPLANVLEPGKGY